MRIGVAPCLWDALRATAWKLHGDHRLDAADENQLGFVGGDDLKSHEGTDFFHADQFGIDEQAIAKTRGLDIIDFGPRDDGDEAGAVHFLEGPAERRGELRAADLDHAQVGDVVDYAAG